MATTLLKLDQLLLESIGDWLQHPVTTALAADTTLVCTHLQNYRSDADYFNKRWIYMEDQVNAGAERQISDDDGTNTLTARTAWVANTTGTDETFRLSRYKRADRELAIRRAIEEIYPHLYLPLEDKTLITGNILPNAHFEDWAATTAPDFYTMQDSNITATALTTTVRGGAKSMNAVTGASGAGKYVYITSNDYPRLLDLMDKTIDFKVWAYPEEDDDATIQIYTIMADGTTQTLTSTTTCPATAWSLLELEDQEINDDIVEIQFRFKITTASKYVYFDDVRVTGRDIYEYLIPDDFQNGTVSQVYIQSSGYSDDICDDLQPIHWEKVYSFDVIDDGTYKYLSLPYLYSDRRIRLIGHCPLESLSAATNALADAKTISLEGQRLNLLIAYAKYKLYQMVQDIPSSVDIGRYENASMKAYGEYMSLLTKLGMATPSITMRLPPL